MKPLQSDSSIRAITCKASHITRWNFIITEAMFGKPEVEAGTAPMFLGQAWILC